MNFWDKLNSAIAENQSLLVVGIDPNPEMMPSRYDRQESNRTIIDNLWDWLNFIIEETSDLVCAYKPTFGFYQALGIPGLELLSKTLAAIPQHIPIILDAKHGDINTSSLLAQRVFVEWQVDAITVSPYSGQDHIAPFLIYPEKAVFVLCCTSNPAATALQHYPNQESPLYLQVVKEAKIWGNPEVLGLEVGTTSPDILAKIRAIAPERVILVRSIWAEGGSSLGAILAAGLNKNGDGLLIPVPQDMLTIAKPALAIKSLQEEIELERHKVIREGSTCQIWMPDVCLLSKHRYEDLILQLYDIGCIMFGEFVQASGAIFPYYIDLRNVISNPQLFHQMLSAYADILESLEFDRIAGIPYGSLPTATGLSLRLHHPMIYPRKEVKAHGTRRVVEGNFHPGETVVVVDDILISGKSVMEGAEKLKSVGLQVHDIVVFIDHEQGVKDRLRENGYRAYSVLTISEITQTLYQAGRINQEQFQALTCH
ncbi:MAG TPA: bifunctional orotidine-5'-phosphate decarboxylase/orotate phosphoribosyltransferase [Cyanobacteria bacterium UBA11149]|nr:bifunctional orotidine-5'-phosphate decarboxylase/orotate phosphoribosyltransferase [Cyanobacteria bacterium UBA11367]HBE56603.1 bifunctional orotidine-5'-phosphate decarboxylase/orotate phosphoribosyltransferase [Cyanobacteria bacterium UBA11366]HBR73822.1 bifunctional orotidine-5'-phosphate decarboxylase/orotate phosphoribosyltransferase [Cyanobacteria bacterium UBA11159]HBS70061.1 bifunctional orotidine-5'-phosphate decarboxylase/orotate phosphoribosyltransferase [Cyanobacteria bacterium U